MLYVSPAFAHLRFLVHARPLRPPQSGKTGCPGSLMERHLATDVGLLTGIGWTGGKRLVPVTLAHDVLCEDIAFLARSVAETLNRYVL